MRLSPESLILLQSTVCRFFGTQSAVYVYGSRTDDMARGGDVDVFVETPLTVDYHQRAFALAALEEALHLPVDLLVKDAEDRDRPIHRIARLTGERLQ
ncbi:MAG: nucleotidyltransferase domain-containing protein [Hydrogenophilales bacterium]|nr:nucleotidyltransferase domain-containing protein [Hydrogenophilales bacterium]